MISKRKFSQLFFALLANANLFALWKKALYRGGLKGVCFPGLNCYSCPLAPFACPLGSLQQALASLKALKWQALSALSYVVGTILLYSFLLGRVVCGWICPFGLFQELLFRIPSPKRVVPRALRYVKYVLLLFLVLLLPALLVGPTGYGKVWFCRLVCPAGTLEAGLFNLALRPELRSLVKTLFYWKVAFLGLVMGLCVVYFRFFCVVLCPLGLIYGFFNRVGFFKLFWRGEDCLDCGICRKICPLNLKIPEEINGCECIRCLNCLKACPTHVIEINLSLTPAGKFDSGETSVKSGLCERTEGHRTNSDR
ncbi:MAG: 4Fe-4S binding protein [Thermodesulfobacteria bacterium]|nr:4Fe-4S binding protein [Thermodesulfobacteriota bacterium]